MSVVGCVPQMFVTFAVAEAWVAVLALEMRLAW